jgi:acetyl esterase/lipase
MKIHRHSRLMYILFIGFICWSPSNVFAQPRTRPKLVDVKQEKIEKVEHVYKTTPQGELKLHGWRPADWKATDKRPVIVFFFGGAWVKGSFDQFQPYCEYLASRGMVCYSADYRVKSIHKTTPDKCVEDGKSAVRWICSHAAELGVDPDKVLAGGSSAGGHVAACTAFETEFNDANDAKVSCKPVALVMMNPVINTTSIDRQILNADNGTSPRRSHRSSS